MLRPWVSSLKSQLKINMHIYCLAVRNHVGAKSNRTKKITTKYLVGMSGLPLFLTKINEMEGLREFATYKEALECAEGLSKETSYDVRRTNITNYR